MLEHTRAALKFRHDNAALRFGTTTFLDTSDPVLAFTRSTSGQTMLCIFNLSPTRQELTLTGDATLFVQSRNAQFSGHTLSLGPNAVAFLDVQTKMPRLT
jgi:alpha-glucosidase